MDGATLEKNCIVCGNKFIPHILEDDCCSPFCRSMKRVQDIETQKKQEENDRKAKLDSIEKPPRFNLTLQPKARAEWFMSLPEEYKPKFSKYLTPKEMEWAREIAQKNLAEDRFYSGIYVKNGKVMEVKSSSSDTIENGRDDNVNDDDETDF